MIKPAKRTIKRAIRRLTHWKNRLTDRSPKLLVCVYHRVIDRPAFDPFGIFISEKEFVMQIEELLKIYPVISLGDAIKQSRSGKVKSACQAVLTFDDGYRDNYETAFPILKKRGLPATFYVATDYIGADKPLWYAEVIGRICDNPLIDRVPAGEEIFQKGRLESSRSFALRVFEGMKGLSRDGIDRVIEHLKYKAGDKNAYDCSADLCMKWDQVDEMSRNGFEIGAHGSTHRSLVKIGPEEASREIGESKRKIESRLNIGCNSFAFPFGSAKDYNISLIGLIKTVGYDACALNIHGYNHPEPGLFAFKRIIMDEYTDLDHLLG